MGTPEAQLEKNAGRLAELLRENDELGRQRDAYLSALITVKGLMMSIVQAIDSAGKDS